VRWTSSKGGEAEFEFRVVGLIRRQFPGHAIGNSFPNPPRIELAPYPAQFLHALLDLLDVGEQVVRPQAVDLWSAADSHGRYCWQCQSGAGRGPACLAAFPTPQSDRR
jgi:hypothetical protein